MVRRFIKIILHRNVFDDTAWGYTPESFAVEIPFGNTFLHWHKPFKTEEQALEFVKSKLTPSFLNNFTGVGVQVFVNEVQRVGVVKEWSGEIFEEGIDKNYVNKIFEV